MSQAFSSAARPGPREGTPRRERRPPGPAASGAAGPGTGAGAPSPRRVAFDRQADDVGSAAGRDRAGRRRPRPRAAAPAWPSHTRHAARTTRRATVSTAPHTMPMRTSRPTTASRKPPPSSRAQEIERPGPEPPDVRLEGQVEEPEQRGQEHGHARTAGEKGRSPSRSATWCAPRTHAAMPSAGDGQGQAEGPAAVAAAEADVALGENGRRSRSGASRSRIRRPAWPSAARGRAEGLGSRSGRVHGFTISNQTGRPR